jgi:hypothetical protein
MTRSGLFGGVVFMVVALVECFGATGASGQSVSQSDISKRFFGTWRLVSIESNGQMDPTRGSHPTGMIYYDATGHMAAQIMPDRPRPKYAGPQPTPEEAKTALIGYTAYFGTYSIDEGARIVKHHRMGSVNPGMVGIDAVRRYEFASDDRLILTPVENPKTRLTWERIK